MAQGPRAEYQAKLAAGDLQPDPAQARAVDSLQTLWGALDGYRPAAGAGWWKKRFGFLAGANKPPRGLYLFGDVGRGKSMVMDMFFTNAPVDPKRRVHFHAFMQQVHRVLAEIRSGDESVADPIPAVAARLATEARLLCFDEFQVQDIADAMILGRLFDCLLRLQVVMVITANLPPDDLYKDGLQRDLFMPFIELIGANLSVLELDGNTDYRLEFMRSTDVYLIPVNSETNSRLRDNFLRLTNGREGLPDVIDVQGRRIQVPMSADGVASVGFGDLCEQPLGAADYLAIAKRYHTILLSGIPRMLPEKRNEAKRFVTLIDALYEHRVNLICTAETAPEKLYPTGDGAREFKRTASRLVEMQSDTYMEKRHIT